MPCPYLQRQITSLSSSFFDYPLHEEILSNVRSKYSLAQLEVISLCSVTCHLRKETKTFLTKTGIPVVVKSNEVSPSAYFSQDQSSYSSLISSLCLFFFSIYQLCYSSLNALQKLNKFLVVRDPKLSIIFEVQSHQCQVYIQGDINNKNMKTKCEITECKTLCYFSIFLLRILRVLFLFI